MANQLIENKLKELMASEQKEFMIAYQSLPEEIHGYLSALPQKVKVWGVNIKDEEYDELKKHYPVSQWTKDGKGSGLFYDSNIPFLGVDGCLAHAKLEHPNIPIEIKFDVTESYVKASVKIAENYSEGIAVIDKRSDTRKDAVEISASNALRKALSYLGYGRFATYDTPYGENKLVKDFRAFVKEQKK